MKGHLFHAYVVVIILAILSITASVGWRTYSIRADRYRLAIDRFRTLSREAATLWQTGPFDNAVRELAERLNQRDEFQPVMLRVAALDAEAEYIWAASDRFFPSPYDYHLHAVFPKGTGEFTHTRFARTFDLPDGERRIVTAVFPLFRPGEMFIVFRDALFAAIAVVILTVAVAVYTRSVKREPARTVKDEHVVSPSPEQPTAECPPLLYSGDQLEERLNAELERASFSEQDLAVAIFRFNRGKRGDETYRRNCETLRSFFVFKDLCFEYDTHDAAVLIPNVTLKEALGLIERFQRYYWEQRTIWQDEGADFHCGVTARNARLVDADRILSECGAALRRSAETPGHIVGFQPDPQKYRAYLSA